MSFSIFRLSSTQLSLLRAAYSTKKIFHQNVHIHLNKLWMMSFILNNLKKSPHIKLFYEGIFKATDLESETFKKALLSHDLHSCNEVEVEGYNLYPVVNLLQSSSFHYCRYYHFL